MSSASVTKEVIAGPDEGAKVSGDDAGLAVGQETLARLTTVGHRSNPTAPRVLKEIGKQAIDQPGHFVIGAGPIWASRFLVGVPWYGWAITPLLAYREWLQWPSKRWWDPPLDWAFLTLGAVAATWRRRSGRDLTGHLAAIRQGCPVRTMRRGGRMSDAG